MALKVGLAPDDKAATVAFDTAAVQIQMDFTEMATRRAQRGEDLAAVQALDAVFQSCKVAVNLGEGVSGPASISGCCCCSTKAYNIAEC